MPRETENLSSFDIPIGHFHDRSARWLFQDSEYVLGLVQLLAPESAERIDFGKMELVSGSFILDNLRGPESDIVVRVPFRDQSDGEDLLIYILIEHQSTIDSTMPFRLLLYMTQIWDTQRRQWESEGTPASERRLRMVLPIVFYTGDKTWTASLSLDEMMGAPDELSRFVPKFDVLFLGVKDTDDADLTKTGHPIGWLLTVLKQEHASKEELRGAIIEALSHISALDDDQARLRQQAIGYIQLLIFHRREVEEHEELSALVKEHIPHPTDKEEAERMAQTMADYVNERGEARGFQRGIEQGVERGIEQGIERGTEQGIEQGTAQAKQAALLKLLQSRFYPVPENVINRITLIHNLFILDSLFESALNAETLDEIALQLHDGTA